MIRLRCVLTAFLLLVPGLALAAGETASCELAAGSVLSRSAEGLAQVSNVGDIVITCSVQARKFSSSPDGHLEGLKVFAKVYRISGNSGETLTPSEVNVTGGSKSNEPTSVARESALFHLHVLLEPAQQEAEAERFWDRIQESLPQDQRTDEARKRALERLRQLNYQHRVGRFRVECRVMDGTTVLGVGNVQLEIVFKGRFSDLGLPGVPTV